jgi:hypothetical protein
LIGQPGNLGKRPLSSVSVAFRSDSHQSGYFQSGLVTTNYQPFHLAWSTAPLLRATQDVDLD